jgi:hypothetical protein
MNAGGVPNTCKSSGKALHLVFDREEPPGCLNQTKVNSRLEKTATRGDRIMSVEYTSGGRLSNT